MNKTIFTTKSKTESIFENKMTLSVLDDGSLCLAIIGSDIANIVISDEDAERLCGVIFDRIAQRIFNRRLEFKQQKAER